MSTIPSGSRSRPFIGRTPPLTAGALLLAFVATCSPDYKSGVSACAPAEPRCPEGFECRGLRCYTIGSPGGEAGSSGTGTGNTAGSASAGAAGSNATPTTGGNPGLAGRGGSSSTPPTTGGSSGSAGQGGSHPRPWLAVSGQTVEAAAVHPPPPPAVREQPAQVAAHLRPQEEALRPREPLALVEIQEVPLPPPCAPP